ncbi:MAG: FAD-binding oxidoreductase [Chloroflexi bacterium]|nr:FAD-binding oxidoreductase [Chloroflexota bacterium]
MSGENHRPRFRAVSQEDRAALQEIVGEDALSDRRGDLEQHARDAGHFAGQMAELVIWPANAEQVAQVLRYCNDGQIPVTAWGAGSGLEGNAIPVCGGVSLSMTRMNRILDVHADDFQVTCQPGIGYKDLNEQLAREGLFFPPDPGANASIGGMIANNAAGIRTVKYGATKDNVLRMQVALADGSLIEVGSRSIKQSCGYDLLHLIIGSEGTLGIVTEATLKLTPLPMAVSSALAHFPDVEMAVEAVVAIRGSGLEPAALEFMDAHHVEMINRSEGMAMEEKPTLFMEFHHSNETALQVGLEFLEEICAELGATGYRATADPAERRKLWHVRHHSYEIMVRSHPGMNFLILDVAVPISAYPALIHAARERIADRGAVGYFLGHAGDGNIHIELPFPEGDERAYHAALALNDDIVAEALALRGTATGEHGVGMGKAHWMEREHGKALGVMRSIKETLDPKGILNPGKIFPQDVPELIHA